MTLLLALAFFVLHTTNGFQNDPEHPRVLINPVGIKPTQPRSSPDWNTMVQMMATNMFRKCSESTRNTTANADVNFVLNLIPIAECLKNRSLKVLERASKMQRVPLYYGVELVRSSKTSRALLVTSEEDGWYGEFTRALTRLFDTHVIKLNVDGTDKWSQTMPRRRHRRQMNAIMMFGFVAMIMILIPLGFKFLTILGTKALLLAKMALLLSSIQGLKRIATSSFNYGLYQQPLYGPYAGGHEGLGGYPGYDHAK